MTKSEEQTKAIKDALLESVFTRYHALINTIKSIPIDQNSYAFNHALISIDSGILWVKELLVSSPLNFAKPEPEPVPVPVVSPEDVNETPSK